MKSVQRFLSVLLCGTIFSFATQSQVILNSGVEHCAMKSVRTQQTFKTGTQIRKWNYSMDFMDLELWLLNISGPIQCKASQNIKVKGSLEQGIYMELNRGFKVDSAFINEAPVAFTHDGIYDLTLFPANHHPTGEVLKVEVCYSGWPLDNNTLFVDMHDTAQLLCTLSEPYGSRDWWPGKNDLTDKLDSVVLRFHTLPHHRVAANGLLMNEKIINGERLTIWKHLYPIAPYLLGFAATNYVSYSDTAWPLGTPVNIQNYVYPEAEALLRTRTIQTVPVMELFSELFGMYPFIGEKYGHAQIEWGGGMENQTMSLMGRFDYEIIAHELAHQWFGDCITLNSWHDIWLNEGFATYLAGMSYEHLFDGYYWPFWKAQNIEYVTSRPGGSVYVKDTTDVNRIFDPRLSYSKGALVLHMLRWIVGDETFFRAVRRYLNAAQYGFAGTAQLREIFELESGKSLSSFFDHWIYGEGFPSFQVKCDRLISGDYRLDIHQTTSHGSVAYFRLPLPLRFYGEHRDTTLVVDIDSKFHTTTVSPGFYVDSVSIDPERWLISANNKVVVTNDEQPVQLYPNPAKDAISLSYSDKPPLEWHFSDCRGRKFKPGFVLREGNISFNLQGLAAGLYFLSVTLEHEKKVFKFVKR